MGTQETHPKVEKSTIRDMYLSKYKKMVIEIKKLHAQFKYYEKTDSKQFFLQLENAVFEWKFGVYKYTTTEQNILSSFLEVYIKTTTLISRHQT